MKVLEIKYEVGDIVKLRDRQKYNVIRLDDGVCDLFVIELFEGNMVKLHEVDDWININEISPVLIDGKQDRLIWEDCIIAASTIADGDPMPIYHIDKSYFMDKFKHVFDGTQSLYDIVVEKKYQYVHDVQHWLRENGHTSSTLKINGDELLSGYLYKRTIRN